jgi:hypothetical protein
MQQKGGAGLFVQQERRKKWGCCCPLNGYVKLRYYWMGWMGGKRDVLDSKYLTITPALGKLISIAYIIYYISWDSINTQTNFH